MKRKSRKPIKRSRKCPYGKRKTDGKCKRKPGPKSRKKFRIIDDENNWTCYRCNTINKLPNVNCSKCGENIIISGASKLCFDDFSKKPAFNGDTTLVEFQSPAGNVTVPSTNIHYQTILYLLQIPLNTRLDRQLQKKEFDIKFALFFRNIPPQNRGQNGIIELPEEAYNNFEIPQLNQGRNWTSYKNALAVCALGYIIKSNLLLQSSTAISKSFETWPNITIRLFQYPIRAVENTNARRAYLMELGILQLLAPKILSPLQNDMYGPNAIVSMDITTTLINNEIEFEGKKINYLDLLIITLDNLTTHGTELKDFWSNKVGVILNGAGVLLGNDTRIFS
jgi:hypothetical protein